MSDRATRPTLLGGPLRAVQTAPTSRPPPRRARTHPPAASGANGPADSGPARAARAHTHKLRAVQTAPPTRTRGAKTARGGPARAARRTCCAGSSETRRSGGPAAAGPARQDLLPTARSGLGQRLGVGSSRKSGGGLCLPARLRCPGGDLRRRRRWICRRIRIAGSRPSSLPIGPGCARDAPRLGRPGQGRL